MIASATLQNFIPRAVPEIHWYRDPLISCGERGCLALSSDSGGTFARPFHPFVGAQLAPVALSIPYDPRVVAMTRNGDGHVAVWATPTDRGDVIRARFLTSDGTAASDELELGAAVAVTRIAAATLDGDLAIATVLPGFDGVARVAVRVTN